MARIVSDAATLVGLCALLAACDPTLLLNEYCATDADCTVGQCDARGICTDEGLTGDGDGDGDGAPPDGGITEPDDGGVNGDGDGGGDVFDAGNSAHDAGTPTLDGGIADAADVGDDGGRRADAGLSDSGAMDAGPTSWQLVDDDAADFGEGTSTEVIYFMEALQLGPGQSSGVFDSRPFVTGTPSSELHKLTASIGGPFGTPLPDGVLDDEDVTAWAGKGFDMTDAVILLHFDRPVGETVSAASTAVDTTGYNGLVSFVDNPPLENSVYEPGPLHNGVHIAYEDYFVLEDSDDAARWAFEGEGMTWAVWMKTDGCGSSEDNVIAIGGELPHIWLGATCAPGNANFRISGVAAMDPVSLVDNAWHHVAGVFEPSADLAVKLYVDGALVSEEAGTFAPLENFTKKLFLGNFPIGTDPLYTYKSDVVLDELLVLRRAATPNEIAHLYARGGTSIRFQIEVCATANNCLGTFFGPDLTANTFYDTATHYAPGPSSPFTISPAIPGAVFRYRASFFRRNTDQVPALTTVTLDAELP